MHARTLTYALGAITVLFLGLGVLLDLWFYVVAGCALAFYLTWRYAAFRSFVSTLQLEIARIADRTVVRRGESVTFTVSVTANAPVRGVYADKLPRGVELVGGTNEVPLSLPSGGQHTWRYTVRAAGRENVTISRSMLAADNGLFAHTITLATAPVEVPQAIDEVAVEAAPGTQAAVSSTPVQMLYKGRRAGAGIEISHLRPYVPGDPSKQIHWRASARLNKLMTKELVTELDALGAGRSVSLIIDQSSSMARGPAGATELDFAVNVASHFVKSAVTKGNRIGMVAYDDEHITTNLKPDDTLSHVSNVVRSLNTLEPHVSVRHPHYKRDLTGMGVARIREHCIADEPGYKSNEDARHFHHIVSHLYRHGEGYLRDLRCAPAFQAISATIEGHRPQSTLILVSDLENDLGPLYEGVRRAARRGTHVYVIALFPQVFERVDDPLLAIEGVYAAYEAHRKRTRRFERIPNVTLIEANEAEMLHPVITGGRVT